MELRGIRRVVAAAGTVALVMGGAVPVLAQQPTTCIDLTPETATNAVGTTHSVTAQLRTGTTENCTGQPTSPQGGNVRVNFEISGANAVAGSPDLDCSINGNETSCEVEYTGVATGTDTIVGYIDADNDDVQDTGEASDSVTKVWTAPANTLDCDDQTGPDTERETNTGSSGTASNEVYTCVATTTGGARCPGRMWKRTTPMSFQ